MDFAIFGPLCETLQLTLLTPLVYYLGIDYICKYYSRHAINTQNKP